MKYSNSIILTLSIIVGLGVQSCSQENEFVGQDKSGTINIQINDSGIQNSDPQTRTTTENYITSFTEGDQIGLFAVRNGAVLNAINNAPVTYSSGEGWESLPYTEELEGATYYAYYPYSNDVKNLFDATKSDPFEDVASNWVIGTDQSSGNYMKYDLMTASASPVSSGRSFNLVFTFAHRMSLAIVQLPYANIRYEFTNANLDNYVIASSSSNEVFRLNDTPVLPYYDAAKREYRMLVKPGEEAKITGTFVYNEGATKSYQTAISNPAEKTYYNLLIDGGFLGEKTISHTLKVGDRFYSDGTIQAVDALVVTLENCVGFVVYVGNPAPSVLYPNNYTAAQDVLLREHPKCTHGIVLGLKELQKKFANSNAVFVKDWFATSGLADTFISTFGGGTANINSDGAIGGTQILGYNNTRVLQEFTRSYNSTEYQITFENLKTFSDENPVSNVTTGWYIPSVQELKILDNLEEGTTLAVCNNYLFKYGGVQFKATRYWSSTESSAVNAWCTSVAVSGESFASTYYRTAKTNTTFYSRYVFAF